MRRFRWKTIALRGGCILISIIFLVSSGSKFSHPYEFLQHVYSYRLVGPDVALGVAIAIPALELVLGLSLLAGLFVQSALFLASLTFSAFTVVTYSAVTRGLDISCGCFEVLDTLRESQTVSYASVARAGGLAVLSMLLLGLSVLPNLRKAAC